MATTEIHAIQSTPGKALGYIIADKIECYTPDKEVNEGVPHEIFQRNGASFIRYLTLSSYQDCNAVDPYNTYKGLRDKWKGTRYHNNGAKAKSGKEPLMWHMHQSFDGFEVTCQLANEIGRKLAEEVFKGFTVTISTHGNTNNIHNHFIVSAWDENGKKWNNCNTNYRNIRRVSDRLCEEYGLRVLEKTKEVKLIRYKDEDGTEHYYEPTERKNEIIRKREEGKRPTDDVGSYRNTPRYEETQIRNLSNRDEIKRDIDNLLPSCRSYEELIKRLRELGYIVRDKKKNGEWLAHISFQAPSHDKATREDKIGDAEFYTRESLEKYIESNSKDFEQEHKSYHRDNEPEQNIPFFAQYEYGVTELSNIDDNYKTVQRADGRDETIERSEVERKVLSDIRVKDSEVCGLIDTAQLHEIIAEQGEQDRQNQPAASKTREERLVSQIQSSFRCLQYIEKKNIYSYEQIIDLYSASKGKYEETIKNFMVAEQVIGQWKEALLIPQKLSALLDKIESNKNDVTYIMEEHGTDKKAVEDYKAELAKHKIITPQGQAALAKKVSEFEPKQNKNREIISGLVMQMSELENCIRTFDRIDSDRGCPNTLAMEKFERLVRKETPPDGDKQGDNRRQERRER